MWLPALGLRASPVVQQVTEGGEPWKELRGMWGKGDQSLYFSLLSREFMDSLRLPQSMWKGLLSIDFRSSVHVLSGWPEHQAPGF